MEAGNRDFVRELDHAMPALAHVKMGVTMTDIINAINAQTTAINALVTKYNAFLAHVDTANVAGISNTNVATYPGVASTVSVKALGAR